MAEINRTAIYLPKVAPVGAIADVKQLAERVDRTLSSLVEQLRSFEAAGALTIDGVPASSIVSGSSANYFQTFEDDVTDDWLLRAGSKDGLSYTNNGQAGGRALRTTNKAVWIAENVPIPFDPARLYRIRARVRKISGTSRTVVVGVEGVGADKETVVDRSGSTGVTTTQNLVGINTSVTSTSWATYSGYFKGTAATGTGTSPSTNAAAPRTLHNDTRYIRPFLAMSIGGDDGVYEIDYITLEVLTETLESNELTTVIGGRSVTTIAGTVGEDGVITEDNVDGTSIEAGSIGGGGATKAHIDAGTIIATDLFVERLSAITANMGTIYAGTLNNLDTNPTVGIRLDSSSTLPATWASYIDMVPPTDSDYLFKFPGLTITKGGIATFGGNVSATSFTSSGTITVNGSFDLALGSGVTLLKLFKIAADSAGIRLNTAVSGYPDYSIYNDGAGRLIIRDEVGSGEAKGELHITSIPLIHSGAIYPSMVTSFAANDATPSVLSSGYRQQYFQTANSSATTITNFDDGDSNQIITVFIRDANTTLGFSGANLIGNNDADWVCTGADVFTFLKDSSTGYWRLVSHHSDAWDHSATPLFDGEAISVTHITATGNVEIDGALNHDGSTYGLCGATPSAQSDGWAAFSNSATRKTGDASSISTAQLAQVVDTLIKELVTKGLLSDVT